jgi:hypothetical protein
MRKLKWLMWNIYHVEYVRVGNSVRHGYFVFNQLVAIGRDRIGED